jgi:hypothetical protein
VIGTNAAGTGTASPSSSPVVAVAAPGAPTIATVTPGDAEATVTWTPAAGTGSVVYHAVAVPTGLSTPTFECTAPSPGTSCTITGLTNTTAYTITVFARGLVDSAPSAGQEVTPSITPGAPTVTAVAGNASIAVTWTAGAAGSGVGGFLVTADPGPATCTAGPTDTGCVLGAVTGKAYTVSVVARGTYGRDSAPGLSGSVTPAAPPVPATPPAPDATLTTDQGDISTAVPGQKITVVGHGFAAFSTVRISVYSTPIGLADAVADEHGDVREEVTVPASLAAGQHTLVALGVDANGTAHTVSVSVAVPAAAAALPVTGLALTGMLAAGLGSMAGGAGLLLAGRRPRRTRIV